MKENLLHKIEAILFYLAEPVDIGFLAKTLEVSKEDISNAITELETSLENRGVKVVIHNNEVTLVTAPEFSELIEKIIKEERERDLGRAGIETLSIIAYKGPVSKKEIEYIRGVNSQWALRSLLLRGLVEKRNSETDMRPTVEGGSTELNRANVRTTVYSITSDTLRHLGISRISDLPEYAEIQKQLEVTEEPLDTETNE